MAVQNLPFIENMENRIKSASLLLDGSLGHCFVAGLEHRDAHAVYNCLRAYAAIDNTGGAEELFRTTVVSPMIQKIIPYGSSEVVNGASSDELEEDYRQIMKSTEMECKFLLEISSSSKIYFTQFQYFHHNVFTNCGHVFLEESHVLAFSFLYKSQRLGLNPTFPAWNPAQVMALYYDYPLSVPCINY